MTRTPLSRSKGQRSRSGRCSGDRGNVLSVGIYCYVAVCRCGRLGGARLFGTHRGRRVAGHIVAAPARLVCFDVQFHNVSVMNVKFVCRRVAVACDRVKSLQRFEWRSSIHLDAKVRMLNALGCSSSSVYGAETRPMTKSLEWKLDAFRVWRLRRLLRTPYIYQALHKLGSLTSKQPATT